MHAFTPMGKKSETKIGRLVRENREGIYREPEFYRARGLGTPHRLLSDNVERQKSALLGETEI